MDELRNVIDIIVHLVGAAQHPVAVAMAAKIGRDDVVVAAQCLRRPVPVTAMVAPAMDHQHGGCVVIPPIDIVEAQPLREVDMGRGADPFFHGGFLEAKS